MTPPWADDLPGTLVAAWERLSEGAGESTGRGAVSFATQGPDGPEVRTVVLRRVDRMAAEVEVHSDASTAKVRALARDPRAALVLWDAGLRLQVRARLRCRIVTGDEGRWAALSDAARWNYGAVPPPGTPIDTPGAWTRPMRRERFAAIVGAVEAMDTVLLDPAGHRRAIFRAGDGFAGQWLSP